MWHSVSDHIDLSDEYLQKHPPNLPMQFDFLFKKTPKIW